MLVLILLLGLGNIDAYQVNSTESNNWISNRKEVRKVAGARAGFAEIAALLQRDSRTVFCGAGLISERHALTSAQCVQDREPSSVLFAVGHGVLQGADSGLQLIPVSDLVLHEDYDVMSQTNDIAMILLEWEVVALGSVRPACLPRAGRDITGRPVVVVGWSWDEESRKADLRQLLRTVIPHSECAVHYGLVTDPPLQICTDVLREDSPECEEAGTVGFWPQGLVWRDPVSLRYVLMGLVSYGLDCSSPTPGVSTDLSAYLIWIQRTIQGTGVPGRICQV